MEGRTWKARNPGGPERVREMLIRRGAIEDRDLKNPYELWRVRIEKVVFTAYKTGSIYCNGGTIPELAFLYKSIGQLLEPADVS